MRSRSLATLCLSLGLFGPGQISAHAAAPIKPNILWITAEDINPHLGCYGDTNAVTPNLDRFASQGQRFTHCWSTSPVCAPARTALISGLYPASVGGQHMRSQVGMPDHTRMYPQLLRDQGYYCVNNAKEDYNLVEPGKVWDESSRRAHWTNRPAGKPFFAVFNIETTHESRIRARPHQLKHDPAKIRIPAYHPDTAEVRHDWAQYYDNITTMDGQFAARLKELEHAGLAEDTIVFFFGDNGSGMPRSKRWPYNSGLHVPLIIRIPEKFKALAPAGYRPASVNDRLVGFVDFAPTLVSLAGGKPPQWLQGSAFLGPQAGPAPKYQFGSRGRMDERIDFVRSVSDGRYVYVRNYLPHLIYGQHLAFMFETPTTRVWKQLFDEGKLSPTQSAFWKPKPAEELYDLQVDPDEVKNLAGLPEHQKRLEAFRQALHNHLLEIRDLGFLPEAEMHLRAGKDTPYVMGRDDTRYPLTRILETADLASLMQPEAVGGLRTRLGDPDSAVRYWAALGLLMRGERAVQENKTALRHILQSDPSDSVRILAAEALGRFGDAADLPAALELLGKAASPKENGPYLAIAALNAIEVLGPKAQPLHAKLKSLPATDPKAPQRANGYVKRLLESIGVQSQNGAD